MDRKLPYPRISPEPFTCQSALEHYLNAKSGLEHNLLVFVKLRASLLNGCAFCIDMHTWELRKINETADRISGLSDWRSAAGLYTQRERAALAWTNALTQLTGEEPPPETFAEASAHFTEKELVDLSWVIASINAWNRMGIAFQPRFRSPADGS